MLSEARSNKGLEMNGHHDPWAASALAPPLPEEKRRSAVKAWARMSSTSGRGLLRVCRQIRFDNTGGDSPAGAHRVAVLARPSPDRC